MNARTLIAIILLIAVAGGGDRAAGVVRPGAGAHDRAVPYAPRALQGHAAGGRSGRQVAVCVSRDGAGRRVEAARLDD